MDQTIATIEKNANEELRVLLTEYKGKDLISLRIFYRADDGEMKPGKAGFALRRELIPDLKAAIDMAALTNETDADKGY